MCFLFVFSATVQAKALKRYHFDIDAQPVNSALIELALQRELNVVYLASLTKNLQANSLSGEYTLSEALNMLLKNSGLQATIANNRLIQIQRIKKSKPSVNNVARPLPDKPKETKQPPVLVSSDPDPIEKIEIVARIVSPYNLGTTVSTTKTQRDFLQTPQIVNALPEQVAKDSHARNYTDSVSLASSVAYLERSAGVIDELRLRGFAYPALKVNGMSSHAYIAPVDVAFIDSIEVAKGPSSVIFGRMEPGGVINMMLKKPGVSRDSISLRFGDDDFQRAELDFNWAYSDQTEFRTVGFIQQHGHEKELNLDDAEGVMLAMSHQFEEGGELNLHYRFESQNVLQQFGQPVEGFDSGVQFFLDDMGEIFVFASRQDDLRAGLDIDRHSLNLSINDWLVGDWSVDMHFQLDSYQANSLIKYPIIEEFVIDVNGNVISSDDLNDILLNDDELFQQLVQGLNTLKVDPENIEFVDIEFSYDTHFLSGELTAYKNVSLGAFELEQLYGVNINNSMPETLLWQTHDIRSNFVPTERTDVLFYNDTSKTELRDLNAGVFGQWVVDWRNFTAFFGARIDYLEFDSAKQEVVAEKASFIERTFRLGGVYAIADDSAIFVNYSESFSPQFSINEAGFFAEEDEQSAPSSVLFPDPARSYQMEVGIKKTWFNNRLHTACALFSIDKQGIESSIERQRNKGVECDVAGSIGNDWHLTFGFGWLDAEIISSAETELVGNKPRMTPELSARLWLNKDIPLSGLWQGQWSLGYTYIDERFIEAGNYNLLAAYQVFDSGFSVKHGDAIELSIFIRNLFDESYTQGVFNALPYWTNPGRERTVETRFSYYF
ncbi:TonB-dependent siderophore receptor [Thalassotalea fusca]